MEPSEEQLFADQAIHSHRGRPVHSWESWRLCRDITHTTTFPGRSSNTSRPKPAFRWRASTAWSHSNVYGPLVDAQEFPRQVDVTLVEGAVSSQDDLEKIRTVRQRSKLVVALGDCAVTGNVPALRNAHPARKILERIYVEGAQENRGVPSDGVPALLRQAVPVHEVVKVDLHVARLPAAPAAIGYALTELLEGRLPDLGAKVKFG